MGSDSVVFGFDPYDVVFVHKEHGLGAVFSLNIGHDDERVIGLCEKIGHSCFDADIHFPFTCDPIRALLDEKLGLHIAFGRSDHFGGFTGPTSWHDPKKVTHVDWVYVKSVQPRIAVDRVVFHYPGDDVEKIIESDKLLV